MMERAPHRIRARRRRVATALTSFAALAFAASAGAASFDVRWDGVTFPGFGVSEATALDAAAAGIPLLQFSGVLLNDQVTPGAPHIGTTNDLDEQSVVIPIPPGTGIATATSSWTGTNNTQINSGGPLEQLYLVFASPETNTIILNGQPTDITYDPQDVGLTLSFGEGGADWAILQVPSNPLDPTSDPVYYPAVALGPLGVGETAPFELHYQLENPQVFLEPFNSELGLPRWNIYYTSSSMMVPEPATGLLLLAGLGSLAAARRRAR